MLTILKKQRSKQTLDVDSLSFLSYINLWFNAVAQSATPNIQPTLCRRLVLAGIDWSELFNFYITFISFYFILSNTLLCLLSIEVGENIDLLLTAHLLVTSVLCLCVLLVYHAGGQTPDVDPMSGNCWPTVYDAEPTLAQYWVTVWCLTPL